MAELGRRWDSSEMIDTRSAADAVGGPEELRAHITTLYEHKHHDGNAAKSYYWLVREPSFLEDVAALCIEGSVEEDLLRETMGLIFPIRWKQWAAATSFLRDRQGTATYENFERLARTFETCSNSHRWSPWQKVTPVVLIAIVVAALFLGGYFAGGG